ncbi:MAG: hexitol phosphatase HxpB [Bacteroidetes bacterium]|nr:hexitol phosphatase HxpB [Bacteroidota bacterium]
MSVIKAVIFDMDGVIIDSEPFWKQAEFDVFSSLRVIVSEEFTPITQTMTTAEVADFWFKKYPWENVSLKEVEERVISRVIELIETNSCAILGIKGFIERLKAQGLKIGVATNSPYRIIPSALQKVDVYELIDVISSAEFEEKGKPDPAIYLSTAQKLAVAPSECIVVEDSHSGMLAAKKAGMKVVAFSNGQQHRTFELADFTLSHFSASIDFLLN